MAWIVLKNSDGSWSSLGSKEDNALVFTCTAQSLWLWDGFILYIELGEGQGKG